MCLLGERPFDVEIASKADDDDTLALLRNAIICSVDKLVSYIVCHSFVALISVDSLQYRIILTPVFGVKFHFWICKLQDNETEIFRKGVSQQSFYILEDKGFGHQGTNGCYRGREHVSFIIVTFSFSTK